MSRLTERSLHGSASDDLDRADTSASAYSAAVGTTFARIRIGESGMRVRRRRFDEDV